MHLFLAYASLTMPLLIVAALALLISAGMQMAGTSRHRTLDTLLQLKAAGLVAASAAGSLIIDTKGGAASGSLGQGPEFTGEIIIDVSALEIASGDEYYTVILQGSPDANFGTAGNIVELCAISLGAKAGRLSDADKDSAIGRHRLLFTNELNGTHYRYLRIYTVVAGTVATGINYAAYIGKIVGNV